MKLRGTSHNKLVEAGMCQKQLQTCRTRKSLLLGGPPMTLIVIQWFWIALIFILNKGLHHERLEILEQLDIIDCISKYFLIEKMAFCRYLTFSFMMHKFPGTIFSLSAF